MPYLSASAVVIHYEEALYQVYAPLPLEQHEDQDDGNLSVNGNRCCCIQAEMEIIMWFSSENKTNFPVKPSVAIKNPPATSFDTRSDDNDKKLNCV